MIRRWFFLLIALLWASLSLGQDNSNKSAAKAAEQTGAIGGTVVRKDTGEPIRFAHVSLQQENEKPDGENDGEGPEHLAMVEELLRNYRW